MIPTSTGEDTLISDLSACVGHELLCDLYHCCGNVENLSEPPWKPTGGVMLWISATDVIIKKSSVVMCCHKGRWRVCALTLSVAFVCRRAARRRPPWYRGETSQHSSPRRRHSEALEKNNTRGSDVETQTCLLPSLGSELTTLSRKVPSVMGFEQTFACY